MNAKEVIEKLNLTPLPEEGGFYREVFRDTGVIRNDKIPHLSGDRNYSTAIYYLITPEEFSGLHAVKSAEVFHFYCGDPVRMVQIDESGKRNDIILGNSLMDEQVPQLAVPAGVWQGTKLLEGGSWALLGCTVAPGFEFDDFVGGTFESISTLFPAHKEIIAEYTHSLRK